MCADVLLDKNAIAGALRGGSGPRFPCACRLPHRNIEAMPETHVGGACAASIKKGCVVWQ